MIGEQPPLPGLDAVDIPASPAETAAHRLLTWYNAQGLLTEQHVLLCQMILDLARAMGISATKGRAAGTALAAKQLLDALDRLPAGGDEFAKIMAELTAA